MITGASAGIGLAMAKRLAASGHQVWGTSRTLDRLPKLERFHPVVMDLNSECAMAYALEEVEKESGGIDVLINNAGHGAFGPLATFPLDEIEKQWRVLVRGPLFLCQQVIPLMKARGHGTIINVTSLAARFPIPMMVPYSAGKAAMSAFTQGLQLELAGTPIRIVDLQPGDINTGFNGAMGDGKGLDERALKIRERIDADLATAPGPELVAELVEKILKMKNPPPQVVVGDFFQGTIAPLLGRMVPRSWVNWGVGKYFGLG